MLPKFGNCKNCEKDDNKFKSNIVNKSQKLKKISALFFEYYLLA